MSTAIDDTGRAGLGPKGDVRSLMKERAYTELKGLIQNSTFAPGEFLSERQLAARLGMSKTPVKAALERLAMEGFIAVSPQQGIVVRDISVHEVADHFEIRSALETFVLRSIAGKLDPARAGRLRRNVDDQQNAVAAGDLSRCIDLDAEFHILLCEFHGNREINRVMIQLREKMHRVILSVVSRDPGRVADSVAEHAGIAEAVLAGDPGLAVGRLEKHLEYGRQFLISPRRA